MRWTKLDLTCICLKKIKLTHHYFKSSPSIYNNWIDHVNFLHFFVKKICVNPTGVISSLFPPRCCFFSNQRHHTTVPCHTFFPLSQDELADSASSFGNASSRRLPSRAKTEALNPHRRHRPPSPDHPTPTLHWYKKVILTLVTLPTTQSRLHFASSLARAHHRSSTHRCHSLSPSYHVHRPSAQHPRW